MDGYGCGDLYGSKEDEAVLKEIEKYVKIDVTVYRDGWLCRTDVCIHRDM